jgi:DNA-binding transcriptional ArsR family regulator
MREMTSQLNACFSAMSDPTRRAVIEALAHAPATVSALHAPHAMALPTFLRHLSVLESCGLMRSEKTGRVRTCFIESAPLLEVQGWMEWQRVVIEKQQDTRD